MNSYVINLKDATERMDRMRRIFAVLEMPMIRFDAVDRERAAVHPARATIQPKRFREWTPGELGCLLSHYEIWKLISEGDDLFGAVFEDDLHIDPRLPDFLDQSLPPDADIIKLETVNLSVRVKRRRRATFSSVGLHALSTLHTGSGAYLLSRRGARILVDRLSKFDLPPDHLLFELEHPASIGLFRYQCVPALAVQDCFLPIDKQQGGFLSSNMSDRPIWAPASAATKFVHRLLSDPATIPRRIVNRAWLSMTSRTASIDYTGPLQGLNE